MPPSFLLSIDLCALSTMSLFLCVPQPTLFYFLFPSLSIPLLMHLLLFFLDRNSINNLLKIHYSSSNTIDPLSLQETINFILNNEPFSINICCREPFTSKHEPFTKPKSNLFNNKRKHIGVTLRCYIFFLMHPS